MELSILAQQALNKAKFYKSTPTIQGLPSDAGMEVAFAGRSNSGKSTTLNTLCGRRALARTSKTPGRTQHLVVFEIDESRRLIDLPGFGYAKVSHKMKAGWKSEISKYLNYRKSLVGLVLVMDSRHVLEPLEVDLLSWCDEANLQAYVLLNKADKLTRNASSLALRKVREHITTFSNSEKIDAQLFSAKKKHGCEQAWATIATWLCFSNTDAGV